MTIETIETSIEGDFERLWDNHIKPIFSADIEPALKSFVGLFQSQFGQQALTAALTDVAKVATGTSFASVAVDLATTLYSDAKSDATADATLTATQVLQTVQSALQVAKATNGITTTADQTAAATIAAPAT
jgi:hypothetical protein